MNGKKDCLLGIDLGTSSIKAGLFDIHGAPLAFADEGYPLSTPRSGWAEQSPEDWWNALCRCIRRLMADSGVAPSAIIGMSVDATCCTVLAADADMDILRPAIMWMDLRASKQAKAITATGHPALKCNGYGNVSAESMPAKALWLKQNEPELYRRAKHIFECTEWLIYRLTGRLAASIGTAAPRWYYDRPNGGWPLSFYEQIGLGDVLEKFPAEVLDLGTPMGGLTKSAAADLGLAEGLPVGEGGADAFVGMIGLNVVVPGSIAMITGSSHLHLGLCEEEMHAGGMWGSYPDAVVPGLQMVEGGQTSTGAIVNWFASNFCAGIDGPVYDTLNAGAARLPVGAEGLVALDFFQGNRTPHADPDVRGMFYGLSLKHTPVHMYRAIIESICYGTEAVLQAFRDGGMHPNGIYIAGGAVKSAFWTQMHADVCNLPIYVPAVTEAPCLGSAILGAVACGLYSDIPSAAKNMVSMKSVVEPDAEKHEAYAFYYKKYLEIYETSKGWMHDITMSAF